MMKYILFILFSLSCITKAQIVNKSEIKLRLQKEDTLVIDAGKKHSFNIFKPTISDYLYQIQFSEKKVFDTVMTFNKTHIFSQYNNKDNFGRIQPANIGSGFNPLIFEVNEEQNLSLLPSNKSYMIIGANDVKYYDVKIPTTSFVYHNAMRNGAALTSTYTQNIGKRFNFALEYMGLRSQGLYRNSLSANNYALFSGHYASKSENYEIFAHYLHQNINNQESGGITEDNLFQSGDRNYNNRQNAQVNLASSSSQFSYRRYYLSQQFLLFNAEKFFFSIKHIISHQGNKYYYHQATTESYWYSDASELINGFPLATKKYSDNFSNVVSLICNNEKFKLDAGMRYQMIKLGIRDVVAVNDILLPKELEENRIGAIGNLQAKLWDKVLINSFLELSNGSQFKNYLKITNNLKFEPVKDFFVNARVNFQNTYPSFNYLLNTSVYNKFNYYFKNARNQSVMEFSGSINLKWLKTEIFANYFKIDRYTYFDSNASPKQSESSMNFFQMGGKATVSFNKFYLNARLHFQNALTNKELFPMPGFIGRGNFFYQTQVFEKAAEIQAGVKVYYFSKFASREYFPVLNEYILQNANSFSIGGHPIADIYINMKAKKMFFFIEGQQVGAIISNNKAYAFPHYPVYDFRLNIGIVWYLFN